VQGATPFALYTPSGVPRGQSAKGGAHPGCTRRGEGGAHPGCIRRDARRGDGASRFVALRTPKGASRRGPRRGWAGNTWRAS